MDADISAALAPEALAPPIARELGLPESAVIGVLRLLAAGAQPAFVARFRPERAGDLTLRDLERVQARAAHAVAFELKRAQLRQELSAKERLDEEALGLLASATHVVEFDDLRVRKRKRSPAGKARGRGLTPLARQLWACGSDGRLRGPEAGSPQADPLELAGQYPSKEPEPKPKSKSKAAKSKSKADPQADAQSAEEESSVAETTDATEATASDVTAESSDADAAPESTGAEATEATASDVTAESSDADAAPESTVAEATEATASDVAAESSDADAAPESTGMETTEADAADAAAESSGSDGPEFATADAPVEPSDSNTTEAAAEGTAESSGSDANAESSDSEAEDVAAAAESTEAADLTAEPSGTDAADESAPATDAAAPEPAAESKSEEASDESVPRLPSPERDLAGARLIVADEAFVVPVMQRRLRALILEHGRIRATLVPGKKDKGGRYAKLAERVEPIAKAHPTHLLGLWRGEREGALQLSIEIEPEQFDQICDELLEIDASRPCGAQLRQALHEGWLGAPGKALRTTARKLLKQRVDRQAITEFCDAYRPLLMAPALGPKPIMAIDPGFAPGCKVAVLSAEGEVLVRDTLYPLQPKLQAPQAKARIVELATAHQVAAIVVNNANGGRDVERLAREAVRETEGLEAMIVSGDADTAALFASSRLAKQQLPKDDASMRRAISVGRRLQNPLAELSKLDARKLPLGQHQHEVDQEELRAALEQVLISSVNELGIDVNQSSADDLARVAGFSHALAKAVVAHREQHGPFPSRQALLEVPGVPGKAFEQGAGFLRIVDGEHALDRTNIHPERYGQIAEMARELGVTVGDLLGNEEAIGKLETQRFLGTPGASGEPLGKPTLARILEQLRAPGADPRPPFEPVEFEPSLEKFEDLTVGMELPGVVTHLANFGAFVDVGLREEALVHVSELTHGFISSPFEAVHVGQRVRGRVIEISPERKRFSLSLRALMPKPEGKRGEGKRGGKRRGKGDRGPRRDGPPGKGKGRRGRKGDRGGAGRGKDRDNDRVLGFKLDLSDLAERLGKG